MEVEPKRDEKPRSETEKRYKAPIKYEKSEIAHLKTEAKARKNMKRKKAPHTKHRKGPNQRRTVLAFILFLALAGAYFYYQGVGDFGKLTGSLRSIKKEDIPLLEDASKVIASLTSRIKGNTQPEAAKNVGKKPAKKRVRVARNPMPRSESPPQSKTVTPQRNLLGVKKSHKSAAPIQKEKVSKKAVTPIQERNTSSKAVALIQKRETPSKAVAGIQKREVSDKKGRLSALRMVSYPYSIHLGSYGSLKRAKKAVSIYKKKGLSPYWVQVDLGDKGVWFRIFTGYFPKREEADAYIKEKEISEAKSKHTRYANLIGVYNSQKELNRKRLALSKLGYSPYVIAGVDGESLLYTGAFYRKARAEKQRADLASKGIQSKLVER